MTRAELALVCSHCRSEIDRCDKCGKDFATDADIECFTVPKSEHLCMKCSGRPNPPYDDDVFDWVWALINQGKSLEAVVKEVQAQQPGIPAGVIESAFNDVQLITQGVKARKGGETAKAIEKITCDADAVKLFGGRVGNPPNLTQSFKCKCENDVVFDDQIDAGSEDWDFTDQDGPAFYYAALGDFRCPKCGRLWSVALTATGNSQGEELDDYEIDDYEEDEYKVGQTVMLLVDGDEQKPTGMGVVFEDNGDRVLVQEYISGWGSALQPSATVSKRDVRPLWPSERQKITAQQNNDVCPKCGKKEDPEILKDLTMCLRCDHIQGDVMEDVKNPQGICKSCGEKCEYDHHDVCNECAAEARGEIMAEMRGNPAGGLAFQAGVEPKDVDDEQLALGIKVELEHTSDPIKARQIALDHLTEAKDYYTHLAKAEKEMTPR